MLCYGPLVSEFGGPRVHGAPTPSLGGCAPGSAAYDGRARRDNSSGVSNDEARVCGLWGACPVVVVAQRPVDWPAQHGVGVLLLLLQISRCCSSKQYRPGSTVRERCVGGTNDLLNDVVQPRALGDTESTRINQRAV